MTGAPPRVGLVAIGRNEGERLKRCLRSVPPGCPVVYVDSGSTDGSVAFAQGLGMSVEPLSTEQGFTAARARNAGWRRLLAEHPGLEFIQFIDGDCEMDAGWLPRAVVAIEAEPELCAVFGRLHERHPEASFYNALCDDEWNVPLGLVGACGGIALFRVAALREAEGFNDAIIAGEEPDLCLRLRLKGWTVRRIDADMALHDAAITRAAQWWKRTRRGGHAYAEHLARHGRDADPMWRRNRDSILLWALVVPLVIVALLAGALVLRQPIVALPGLGLLLLYPAQLARLTLRRHREGKSWGFALGWAFWMVVGKFAQLAGLWQYHWKRWRGQTSQVIEYKQGSGAGVAK